MKKRLALLLGFGIAAAAVAGVGRCFKKDSKNTTDCCGRHLKTISEPYCNGKGIIQRTGWRWHSA